MSPKLKLRPFFYLILALVLVGLALALWLLRPVNQSRVADLVTPAPVITAAPPPLPTMGYGPLQLTPYTGFNSAQSTSVPAATTTIATTQTQPVAPTVQAGTDLSDRFGLIVTGLNSTPDHGTSLKHLFDLTGAKWWYQYDPVAADQSGAQQIYMVRILKDGENGSNYQTWLRFLNTKKTLQNSYWVVGNEPNVPGQDDAPPEVYAKTLHSLVTAIIAADPTAIIIGPNVLNWNYTCKGCPGYASGRDWFEQMQTAYLNLYQSPLPFAAYSMHTYSLDWDSLPLLNHNRDIEQIQAMRTYLDANPNTRNKPLWLTEFGVIWGYDALGWEKDATGNTKAVPKGNLRTDLITAYFDDTLSWLKANALRLNLARWFIYTSYGFPEPFTNTFSGISLVDSTTPQANLTDYGKIYVRYLRGS